MVSGGTCCCCATTGCLKRCCPPRVVGIQPNDRRASGTACHGRYCGWLGSLLQHRRVHRVPRAAVRWEGDGCVVWGPPEFARTSAPSDKRWRGGQQRCDTPPMAGRRGAAAGARCRDAGRGGGCPGYDPRAARDGTRGTIEEKHRQLIAPETLLDGAFPCLKAHTAAKLGRGRPSSGVPYACSCRRQRWRRRTEDAWGWKVCDSAEPERKNAAVDFPQCCQLDMAFYRRPSVSNWCTTGLRGFDFGCLAIRQDRFKIWLGEISLSGEDPS